MHPLTLAADRALDVGGPERQIRGRGGDKREYFLANNFESINGMSLWDELPGRVMNNGDQCLDVGPTVYLLNASIY